MIREPTVGMRVECTEHYTCLGRDRKGVIGRIEEIDRGGDVWFFVGCQNLCFSPRTLTEIKESDMYLDEALKVIREDKNMEMSKTSFGSWYDWDNFYEAASFEDWYRDSTFKVRTKKPKVKELTVADIEEKYGCKVKIVK